MELDKNPYKDPYKLIVDSYIDIVDNLDLDNPLKMPLLLDEKEK